MLIQTFAIRLLTVLVYFLPFTFFMIKYSNNPEIEGVYNKDEAKMRLKSDIRSEMELIDPLFRRTNVSDSSFLLAHNFVEELIEKKTMRSFGDNYGLPKIIVPGSDSISAIGILCYPKANGMRVAMVMSMFFSLIACFFWRFLRRWLITFLVIFGNFVVAITFMISCYRNDVELMYGFWLLLFLLVIQLWVELVEFKYGIIGRLLASLTKR